MMETCQKCSGRDPNCAHCEGSGSVYKPSKHEPLCVMLLLLAPFALVLLASLMGWL